MTKAWGKLIYPQLEAQLITDLDRLGHDAYRVKSWAGRWAKHRERFRCDRCKLTACVDYNRPDVGHLLGPALAVKCKELKHG